MTNHFFTGKSSKKSETPRGSGNYAAFAATSSGAPSGSGSGSLHNPNGYGKTSSPQDTAPEKTGTGPSPTAMMPPSNGQHKAPTSSQKALSLLDQVCAHLSRVQPVNNARHLFEWSQPVCHTKPRNAEVVPAFIGVMHDTAKLAHGHRTRSTIACKAAHMSPAQHIARSVEYDLIHVVLRKTAPTVAGITVVEKLNRDTLVMEVKMNFCCPLWVPFSCCDASARVSTTKSLHGAYMDT